MENQNTSASPCAEQSMIHRVLKFQLPHQFKRIGFGMAMVTIVLLLVYRFFGSNHEAVKDVFRSLLILFLFAATLSREKVEDEYIRHLRAQSFIVSFILAVAYSIGIPMIVTLFNILLAHLGFETHWKFEEISAFEVLSMLVCFQLIFFALIKRKLRE